MTIRTSSTVFLGVVVQPKTKEPVFVERREYTRLTVEIRGLRTAPAWDVTTARRYMEIGSGYLNDDQDYAGPSDISGYPRSHTPSGVKVKGGGFGTCLYSGLVLLATAHYNREISADPIGRGAGISSTGSNRSRSAAADQWWTAAHARGLTHQMEGYAGGDEPEMVTEELEDEDLDDHISSRAYSKIVDMIHEAVNGNSDWAVSNVKIKVDLNREVEDEDTRGSEELTVDTYTMQDMERHNLCAVRETREGDLHAWAKATAFAGAAYKDVILALNVGRQDLHIIGKLAHLASVSGASEFEVAAMMMRAKFGVDIASRKVLFEDPVVEKVARDLAAHEHDPRRSIPKSERGVSGITGKPPAQNPVFRRNPPATPTVGEMKALEHNLVELEKRRRDLGWLELEDLP